MKYVLREWAKCPKAVWMTAISQLCDICTYVIDAYIVILVTNAIADWRNIELHIPLILGLSALQTFLTMGSTWFGRIASHHSFTELNDRFAARVQNMPYSKFVKYAPDHIQNMCERLGYVSSGIEVLEMLFNNIVHIGVNLIAIYKIDHRLALPVILVYCVGGVASRYTNIRTRKRKKEVLDIKRDRNKEMMETIAAFSETRSNNMQKFHIKSITNKNQRIISTQISVDKTMMGSILVLNSTDLAGLGLVLLYAKSIILGGMDPATIMALVMYVWRLVNPINNIIHLMPRMSEISQAMPELVEILELEDEEDGNITLSSFNDRIEFEDMGFCYEGSENVLQNINLTIHKGEKIGICGLSGGGKSTLIKILCGFYRNYTGSVKVDGIELRDLKISSLRKNLGSVQQSNYIFNESAYDNIKYGNPDASEYDVIEASKKAAVYDFIQNLPQKFNTNVGPKGMKLSGGQQQRLALARVFLKNPDIVLLDEATSALDNESENVIQQAISDLSDKTVITVAHRLSTIINCDRIIVVDNHRIAEIGTHEDLLKRDGVYSRLWKASQK